MLTLLNTKLDLMCILGFYFGRVIIVVKRLRPLPGVKTLFRDSEEAYPWCL